MKKLLILLLTLLLLNVLVVYAQDIDIGITAKSRGSFSGSKTIINKGNPANASGTITSVEIYAYSNLSGVEVATFYSTGTNQFSTRDYELIGSVTSGSKQTFEVNLDVETGDYIGMYWSGGNMYLDSYGEDDAWWKSGDNIPCTTTSFSLASDNGYSLYGTGYTAGWGGKFNTVSIGKWNGVEIKAWNGVE